jgi:hypothetical protein
MRKITSAAAVTALLIGASSLAMAQTATPGTVPGTGAGAPPALGSSGAAGSNGMSSSKTAIKTEAQAKQKLEASGYANIANVHQAGDGWAAKAMKNGEQVSVLIDASGKISVQNLE